MFNLNQHGKLSARAAIASLLAAMWASQLFAAGPTDGSPGGLAVPAYGPAGAVAAGNGRRGVQGYAVGPSAYQPPAGVAGMPQYQQPQAREGWSPMGQHLAPEAAAQAVPAGDEAASAPVLRTYRVPPAQLSAAATVIDQQFGRSGVARIVADSQSSQLFVMAPPAIQGLIAAWLGQAALAQPAPASATAGVAAPSSAADTPPAVAAPAAPVYAAPVPGQAVAPAYAAPATNAVAPAPAAPVVAAPDGSRQVALSHVTALELEARLTEALPKRLVKQNNATPTTVLYTVKLDDGANMALAIDRQTGQVVLQGPRAAVDSFTRLIGVLDRAGADHETLGLVSFAPSRSGDVEKAMAAIQTNGSRSPAGNGPGAAPMLAGLFQAGSPTGDAAGFPPAASTATQPRPATTQPTTAAAAAAALAAPGEQPAAAPNGAMPAPAGLVGPVEIEILEGLDVLVIRGNKQDVEQVRQIIAQLESLSAETQPAIEVYTLQHAESSAMSNLVNQVYSQVFSVRQGNVSITALIKPNALLLIGRPESVSTAIDLVKRLDNPVSPESQFRVFRLRHAAAESAQETIEEFFDDRDEGLASQVRVLADFRSNSLVIQGSPRDLEEVAAVIEKLDTQASEAVNELRVYKLTNSMAEDLAPILQEAIAGQQSSQEGRGNQSQTASKSTMLRFITIDPQGQRTLSSGILTDVRITADLRSNSILASAPAESMPLVEALIRQLDQLPSAEAQIKVFTIVNGDAESLVEMLETLFGAATQAAAELAVRTGAREGESSLVTLRFAVDPRTNSIIASGSVGDLSVVEAILLRLDESDVRNRDSIVYRLKNAPATDVATAINEFLRTERQIEQLATDLLSTFQQIEREVVVVAEPVSNSLIVSATPRFFEDIRRIVEQLDQRPPMVMIQVLIAEVQLNNIDEFGVELGLQDSILFDRSILGELQTVSTTTSQTGQPQVTTQQVVSATNTPGFNFNNTNPLGNSGATNALTTAGAVGTQALSNFAVGRGNGQLGFGGLVLSASSDAVSVLIRALQECRRLEVLSRPQIMTLDNQPAFIQVGQRVPRITGTSINEIGQTNAITLENVGLILGVTPRISPDGLVVMEIDAERSALGPESEGIPISITNNQVIRSPRIDTTLAQTTVSAMDGQTVILGGLLTKNTQNVSRRVPWLSEIPVLGHLFRYDFKSILKTELLIVMTPRIVTSTEDAELLKQTEASRVHWCMADVIDLHGDINARTRRDEWLDNETRTVYPDVAAPQEVIPSPLPAPAGSGMPAAPSSALPPAAQPSLSPALPQSRVRPAASPSDAEQASGRAAASGGSAAANDKRPETDADSAAYDPIGRDPMWNRYSVQPAAADLPTADQIERRSTNDDDDDTEPKAGLVRRWFSK